MTAILQVGHSKGNTSNRHPWSQHHNICYFKGVTDCYNTNQSTTWMKCMDEILASFSVYRCECDSYRITLLCTAVLAIMQSIYPNFNIMVYM